MKSTASEPGLSFFLDFKTFFKTQDFFLNSDFFETKFFTVLSNAHVIYLLTIIAGSKKMNMTKWFLSVLCFMSL